MKPVRDAKVTQRGLGDPDEIQELHEAAEVSQARPGKAVKAIAPTPANAGRYSHIPPRRQTRTMAATRPAESPEKGGTLRPPRHEDD